MGNLPSLGNASGPAYRTFVRGCLLAILLAWPVGSVAQLAPPHRPIRFVRSAVEPFLPQSSIYDILQDRAGFLWFATREGLGRWDGYEMRTWKADPFGANALPDNVVRRIVEDGQGSLWVVVVPDNFESQQLARLVGPGHERVQTLPILDAAPVVDRDGVAWVVGVDSLYRFDDEGALLRAMAPRVATGRRASGAMFDRDGMLWVATAEGFLERYDPSDGSVRVIPYPAADPIRNRFQQFLEDAAGTIWLTGWGVLQLDSTRSRLVRIPGPPSVLDTVGTAGILQDPDGWIWLATEDGVYRFDPARTRVERYPLALPGGIGTQNLVVGLARDRAGAVWAGTVWGLHRYDPSEAPFGFLGHDPHDPNTLSGGVILPLLEDEEGALWAGSLGGGLNRIDQRTGRVQRYRSDPDRQTTLPHDWVWSLAEAGEGRVWVGTESGLALVDPAELPLVRRIPVALPEGAFSRSIYALQPDSIGGVWLGVSTGLVYLDRNRRTVPSALPIPGSVTTIRRYGGHLWVGTSTGLARFDPATGAHQWFRHDPGDSTSLSHDAVLALHQDSRGRLWVGTNSGLNWLAPDGRQFRRIEEIEALTQGAVYSILEDSRRRLWLGTNRGLVRYDPAAPEGRRMRRYDHASGVVNVEFNRGSGLRARDGTFYFGGDQGLTIFHPDELVDNPFIPPVVLTAVHRARRDGVDSSDAGVAGQPVILAPDHYTVTFTFAALSYTDPARNEYAYRLEGFDPQWIRAGAARTAAYTNLPPGRYTFRVRGSNEAGAWNEDGLAIPVVVQPWFWETTWFRGLLVMAVLVVVSSGTAFFQRTRHRRDLAALEYRQALEAERARISRDMHDEVGAGLTEIALLGDLTLRQPHDGAGHRAAIDRIADRSRQMLDALGEIVWAINPDNDRTDRVAAYLREYAADYLESAGIQASLRFETGEWSGEINADMRRQLFLILKEALANAVRHAGACLVEVHLTASEGQLQLIVTDDGRGFDPARAADGELRGHHGMANLRQRAAAIGGHLTVTSAPGQGTRVDLLLERPPFGVHPVRSGR